MDNLKNQDLIIEGKNIILFSKRFVLYFFILIFIIIILFFLFLSPPSNFPDNYIFHIEEGSSLRRVSLDLQEAKIIRSRVLFESFVIIYGGEKHIIPGDYLFEDKIYVFEVAKRISMGKKNMSALKITIPEGFNREEIRDTFSKKLQKFNGELFMEKTKDLEGYLFPDTYFFSIMDTEDEVIKVMHENFNKKIEKLKDEIVTFGKSEKDIIIMASIIEEEAKGDNDREYISGILWKRLSINMPLQVDAAMMTYKEKGLPKNPITNPGLKAIRATLNPKSSPYLYYLHDKDGNIHFAKNFEEHKINKIKYLK